ncbi:MAG: NAD(+)/NADH kinase [Thaumarchaeota archaeon]|nr:NAD(+)/NADH kinase [Nitrososphaerota archaeon]
MKVVSRKPDIGIVVGGDGIFSKYGRAESEPLLFVGVRSSRVTGSKAYMAQAYFDELPSALGKLKRGEFSVREYSRLEVFKDGKSLGEVFTDVYLQRGDESNSLRYKVRVTGPEGEMEESAIGDGVVVTTAAGSTGYYSYPDRIRGESLNSDAHAELGTDRIGICHIVPTFTERSGSDARPLRYSVPWGSKVELWITRPADARLYGAEMGRGGVRVTRKDRITVVAGKSKTKVVLLSQTGQ